MITFEDFKKMDLRVGDIVEAQSVEDSNNLLKMKVDIGEVRQVIAGLKEHYDPEELEGKQVVLVANLEPKEIFGLKSEGMVLAVEGEEVSLLTPDKEVESGSEIN